MSGLCYGLDDTPAGPVYARASRRGRRLRVEASGPPPPGAHLVAGLTEKDAWVRLVEVPLPSRAKALDVLPGLLDVQLPFGIEECAVVCAGLERNRSTGGWTATAAVARRDAIRARLDQWAAAGVEPHALDQEGLALWTRSLDEVAPEPEAPRVVVYLGADRVTLALGQGLRLRVTRGFRQFEPEQALRTARLVFEGRTQGLLWVWAGPAAADPKVVDRLRRGLEPGDGMRHATVADPALFLAGAYARRGLEGGPLRCDFRIGEHAHPEVRRRRNRVERMKAGAALVFSLLLLTAALAWKGLVVRREAQARRAVTLQAGRVLAALGKKAPLQAGYEGRTVTRLMDEVAPWYEPFVRYREPSRGQALGRLLLAARDADAVLHKLEWNDALLRIAGRCPDESGVTRLAEKVEAETGWPCAVTTDRKNGHERGFTLEAKPAR